MDLQRIAGLVAAGWIAMGSAATAQDLGEVLNLRWCEGTKDCLEWDALPGAPGYLVHRGDASSLPLLGTSEADSCIVAEPRANATGRVLGEPAGSSLQWFLVTANEESDPGAGRTLDSSGPCCAPRVVDESFELIDGSAWPAGWFEAGNVDVAEIRDGQTRLRPLPTNYSLARMALPGDWSNVEVTFTVSFEDFGTQGVGFYVRQDGSYLDPGSPAGGYAVFIEGFRGTDGIGIWKEQDGNEISLDIRFDDSLGLETGTRYRVRFRCHQIDPFTTDLRARIWPEGEAEPQPWDIVVQDSSPEQQGLSGGIAIDSWSNIQAPGTITAFTAVDDVVVTPLCNPLDGGRVPDTFTEAFDFTEGPAWNGTELFFSDISSSTVNRLEPPSGASVFRDPSGQSNGLVFEPSGDLLACEHGTRSITRTTPDLITTTVADTYLGDRFNSPNDLTRRSDGTLYFTDPPYGLPDPGLREIFFNGLYRVMPSGEVVAEWMGDQDATRPNGVVLSPGEGVLYMADSAAGTVLAFDVNEDGSLGPPRLFAAGMTTPDGLTVDTRGNVYVATWASTIEVFSPNGGPWGSIPIPRAATNCTFGFDELATLVVTAQEGVYGVSLPAARGVPSR